MTSTAISGRMQSRKIAGQFWSFSATYAPLTQAEFKPVRAFVAGQRGQHGVFTIVLPIESDSSGTGTGTVTCASTSKGESSVTVAGFTGALKAGDFVKFSGHTKVYMLTADRSGAGSLSVAPPLVENVTSSDTVIYNSVPFTVRLGNDVQSYALGQGGFYKYEVDFVEAL
jgi:hypothetical protein